MTASVHAAAWKRLFNEFLKKRSSDLAEPFVPFDINTDYRRYVDGKLRYDGVTSFLKARSIELPQGSPAGSCATTFRRQNSRPSALPHYRQPG